MPGKWRAWIIFGNVQFTGYYTPVVQARYTRQGEFQHPLYGMPAPNKKSRRLPDRAGIYAGALGERNVLAWTNLLMDNFLMEVQGSGYVDFGDGRSLTFFAYGGKNWHAYRSIGKTLIDRGEVPKKEMSMQAIRHWGETHSGMLYVNCWSRIPLLFSLNRCHPHQ